MKSKLHSEPSGIGKVLAIFMALLVVLMPAAVADANRINDIDDETSDLSIAADDIDESANDAEDFGGFDLSDVNSEDQSLDISSINSQTVGQEKIHAAPKTLSQTTGLLEYDEQFNTNLFSGAASYAFPIKVPFGVQGIEPSVYLSYNHHASRSLPTTVGTGWNLNLNYIYRDTKNTRSDTSDDKFVLNLNGLHEKLVFVPSENRYHTEHESYMFVQRVEEGQNELGKYWIVKAKDGTEYRFGYNSESELVSNLEPYAVKWSLDQVKDVNGNKMAYSYIEDPDLDMGTAYLDGIDYGINKIGFVYDYTIYTSPELYSNGNAAMQSAILKEITILHRNELVRKYKLDYENIGKKPFLTSITELGKDGKSELPPAEFSYKQFNSGFAEDTAWELPIEAQFGTNADNGVRLFDVNGDGLIDIVKAKDSSHQVGYNNGKGFDAFKPLNDFIPGGFVDVTSNDNGVRFMDFNGDTRIDVVQSTSGDGKITVLKLNTGVGWNGISYNLPSEISFIERAKTGSCFPPYLEDYECGEDVKCGDSSCVRTCTKTTCSDSGKVVFKSVGEPMWNDNDYDEEDAGAYFNPQSNVCYKFEYTGSSDTDNDDSECYDLYTDDDFDDNDYDEDCTGGDLDAYAGIGFVGNENTNSWLSTVPGDEDYGFISGVDNSYWDNRYLSNYDKDSSPDSSGRNKGDWDGFNKEICDEAGIQTIYCTPSYQACDVWNKDRCGYGCAGEGTAPFVVMGVYADYNNNLWDALDDNAPACQEIVDDNDYFGEGTYLVTEYLASVDVKVSECAIPYAAKDLGVRLLDVNADGMTDIVQATDAATKTWLNSDGKFAESNDWTIPQDAYFVDSNGKDMGVRFADINGDGLIDVTKGYNLIIKTWLNTGKGWEYKPELAIPKEAVFVKNNEGQGVQIVDINLDGLSDLVKAKEGSNSIWLSTGSGWELSQLTLPQGTTFTDLSHQIVDINGDGTADIVKATNSERKTWLGTGKNQYTLKTVKNSMGGTIGIDYKEISSIDNTGSDEVSDLSFNGYVVSAVTYDNGMGNKATHTYNYEGGLFEPETREFRGFSTVSIFNPDDSQSKHYFFQDSAKKGLEYRSQIFSKDNKLFAQTDNDYYAETKDGYYIIRLSSSMESTYDGNDEDPRITKTELAYDNFGNPIKISYLGDVSISDDSRHVQIEYVYNKDSWIVDRQKKLSLFAADGTTKARETHYSYDGLANGETPVKGLLTKEEFWHLEGSNPVQEYEYDLSGNLIKETDPNSHETLYGYDSTGVFVNSITNHLGQNFQFEYDTGTGNLKSETDSNGYVTSYEYDVFGRLIKEIWPYDNPEYPTVETIYNFDSLVPEKVVVKARENSLLPETYDTYNFYDGFGRLVQTKSDAENGQQIVKNADYDGLGRINYQSNPYFVDFSNEISIAEKYVSGMFYNYDVLGRVIEITNPDTTSKELIFNKGLVSAYDENSNRKDYLTDAFGNIIKITEYNGDETYNTIYKYDISDNLLSITDNEDNVIKYTYDSLGRKTRLEDPNLGTWTYSYDAAGNLIKQADNRVNPNKDLSDNDAFKESGSVLFDLEYDANGNLIEGFGKQYEYDAFNRLATVKSGDDFLIAEYAYDENGERVKKIEFSLDGSTETTYYVDNDFIRVVNSSGTYDIVLYHEGSQLVAEESNEISSDSTSSKSFYHLDHLGSTDVVTDSTASTVSNTDYLPFGQTTSRGNSRYTFTGQESDPESRLMYYGARYYDPFTRQFIQPDTILPDIYDPQQLNRYAYARNNPYKYTDPTGHFLDLAVDLGFIAYDAWTILKDPTDWTNWAALGADVGGAIIPFATGLGLAVRAGAKLDDVAKIGKAGNKLGKGGSKTVSATGKVDDIAETGGSIIKKMLGSKKGAYGGGKVGDNLKPQPKVGKGKNIIDVKGGKHSQGHWKSPTEFGLGGPGETRKIGTNTIERIRLDFGHKTGGYTYPHWNQEIYRIGGNGKVMTDSLGNIRPISRGPLDHKPLNPKIPKKWWDK
jgi:RHS repeat-associated protein